MTATVISLVASGTTTVVLALVFHTLLKTLTKLAQSEKSALLQVSELKLDLADTKTNCDKLFRALDYKSLELKNMKKAYDQLEAAHAEILQRIEKISDPQLIRDLLNNELQRLSKMSETGNSPTPASQPR